MEMIARIEASGACSFDDIVRAYFQGGPGADRILAGPGRRTSIPKGKRDAFNLKFGIDALRRPDEQAQKAPTPDEVEAVQESMK